MGVQLSIHVHCCLQVSDNPSMSTNSPEDPVLPKLIKMHASSEDAPEDPVWDPPVYVYIHLCPEDPAWDPPVCPEDPA